MAVMIGSARINEKNSLLNGKAGDQTGKEVGTQTWYKHSKGWVVIRAKDPNVRKKIAYAMKAACDNNNIGYGQDAGSGNNSRLGLFNAVKSKGYDPAKCNVAVNTDCSETVRVCVHYAGITCGDFNTSGEKSVLQNTGKFEVLTASKYTDSSDYLLAGDILVTKTKGHTVVVLSDGAKAVSKPTLANYTVKQGSTGTNARNLQSDLNYIMNAGLEVDGKFGPKSVAALKSWQKKYGLTADGCYGPASYKKMKELLA